ncbi:Gfo/Idh/MocA family oxidoreductase [Natronolimnobius sp. AArcel1]|uniref:D-xylose 1-dehydrogenase Gfo6 n=1 Tax=Natronolimnobius sp. AArcel1 TaxID=1679093 RepID=UPI0013ED63D6|nr:D-xylose 1-dehydrogenase Gfo6 [Natronolimnobius sp. AArcel1]NGM69910.1 Gfo/Idh/MocA family oxidoreductase [Natronolimnobius sp. AArcel1]
MTLELPARFERDWDRSVADAPLRFAVIGLGGFARNTALPCIEESDYCETTAVVSGSAEKASEVAREFDAEHALTYEEYGDGVGSEDYDAVYIVTPNALHLPHVETAAADLEKAVLCEKPLEADADRAARLVEVCEDAGVPLMTAYRMQAARSIRWIRRKVADGLIGNPVQVHGEFSFHVLEHGGPDQWRLDPDLAGGVVLMDIGVYPINTARYVLDADPVAVRGTTDNSHPAFEGVDEHVAVHLEFPDAVTASCTASFNSAGASRFAITGTEGRIVVESVFGVDDACHLTIDVDGSHLEGTVAAPHEVTEEFDYFATAVLTEMELAPDGRHGLTDVQIAEGVYESAEEGTRVEL